jgi:uncharacterized membrane protein YoaK (UPF0700 family)
MPAPEPAPDIFDAQDLGLGLLALGAGSVDALGFFALGGALPSAMTGNTALLGLALGQGDLAAATPPLAAGAGFLLGAALASALLHLGLDRLPAAGAVWRLLALEACLMIGFVLGWQLVDRSVAGLALHGLILLAATGMGMQSVAARCASRSGITTVVFTSTLTSIVTSLTAAALKSPHRLEFAAKRQAAIFLAYGLGAVLGGLLSWLGPALLPFLPLATTVGALLLHLRTARR